MPKSELRTFDFRDDHGWLSSNVLVTFKVGSSLYLVRILLLNWNKVL